jgi:hypothetical protein
MLALCFSKEWTQLLNVAKVGLLALSMTKENLVRITMIIQIMGEALQRRPNQGQVILKEWKIERGDTGHTVPRKTWWQENHRPGFDRERRL